MRPVIVRVVVRVRRLRVMGVRRMPQGV